MIEGADAEERPIPTVPPKSRTDYVVQRLREELRDGKLAAGSSLVQADIASRFGVSPTPVREALRILEAEGWIDYSAHKGATVLSLSAQDVTDLYAVRSAVEPMLTCYAVERGTEPEFRSVEAIHLEVQSLIETATAEELGEWNRRFHFAIYEIGSPLILRQIVEPMWSRFLPRQTSQWTIENRTTFLEEHSEIIDALVNEDARRAEELMRRHVSTAESLRFA